MNYDAYAKGANRGDFQYEVLDYDDYGGVYEETCTYKGEGCGVDIRVDGTNEVVVNIDGLLHPPFYIVDEIRSSRRSARILAERIIRNDREGNWEANKKYART